MDLVDLLLGLGLLVGAGLLSIVLVGVLVSLSRRGNRRRIEQLAERLELVADELALERHPPDREGRVWFTGTHGGRPIGLCMTSSWVRDGGEGAVGLADGGYNRDTLRLVVPGASVPDGLGGDGVLALCRTGAVPERYLPPGLQAPVVVVDVPTQTPVTRDVVDWLGRMG